MTVNGATSNGAAPAPPKAADYHFNTRIIHAGSEPNAETGAVIPPISLATTYKQSAVGVHKGFEYTRSNNPNRLAFEALVAALELPSPPSTHRTAAEHVETLPPALAFSSGSAATAAIVNSLVKQGGHIISVGDVYGGTFRYFTKVATANGIETSFLDISMNSKAESVEANAKGIEAKLEAAFRPNTQLVWIETPTNPTLSVVDVETVARVAHAHNVIVVVDNTFLSSYYQQPLRLGADIVVHSVTKYLNGHSDVIMGVLVCPNEEILDKLRFYQNAGGAVPGQFDSWLAQRGAKTLALRMTEHGNNALHIARWLEKQPWCSEVLYPGLEGDKRASVRALAWKQLSPVSRNKMVREGLSEDTGFPYGGMVSFRLDTNKIRPGQEAVKTSSDFLSALKIFTLAESLGGIESLAELPSVMTHASVSPENRAVLGIDDQLIRLSVGVEDFRDLEEDLANAVKSVSGSA